jgi:hypothetical protein
MRTTPNPTSIGLAGSRRVTRAAGFALAVLAAGLLAGMPAPADDLVRYSVPASEQGVRGNTINRSASVTFHGWAPWKPTRGRAR